MAFVLETAEPAKLGFRPEMLIRLTGIIEAQIAEGRYPGAQIALARHGKLALFKSFGSARIEPHKVPAKDDTLWLLYSNTKVITAAAIWTLVEEGALSFHDKIADHIPAFGSHGKGEITLLQVLTHHGGFPGAGMDMPRSAWEDHIELKSRVCGFTLEWTPGSRLEYHRLAAHWVCAILIEAVAKQDYRDFIRQRIVKPLGLEGEVFVGLPASENARCAEMHVPADDDGKPQRMIHENDPLWRQAGVPGGGGFATARAMAAFYQMMAGGGRLGATRLFSPRLVQYVTRNFTGDRVDHYMGMPMHRGLGPHSRGTTAQIRGLGSLASPTTFGHGGVGSSYCWADPETGVSFAYITNNRVPDPWHSRRLDIVSNLVHAAIEDAK
ncbi:MAG TPA: serine hydrolase domain-containing protein [Stellaceae bacterium]|nr:serine hydrolase domain-containing protein [Stellaceae bacterium]